MSLAAALLAAACSAGGDHPATGDVGGTRATGTGGRAASPGSGGTSLGGSAPSRGGGANGANAGTGGLATSGGSPSTGGSPASGGNGPRPTFGCSACHGSSTNAAPPLDTLGNQTASSLRVGAHQVHLASPATRHHTYGCSECHPVPSTAQDPTVATHMNMQIDVRWGPIAKTGTVDLGSGRCSGSYCHGATLSADAGGAAINRAPVWNVVDGSQAACGTACHSLNPGGSHPRVNGRCQSCHGTVIASFDSSNPSASVWANPALHVNGKIDY
jgi:predicted CxxxxCH...CXXCH cytochrome family protein